MPINGGPSPELCRKEDGPESTVSPGISQIISRLESQEAEIRKAGKLSMRVIHMMEDFLDGERRPRRDAVDDAVPGELLDVFESFHRLVTLGGSVEQAGGDSDLKAFLDGVEIIHAKFLDYLKGRGMELIPAVGRIFDPQRHQAVRVVEVEGGEDGLIIDEIAPGYEYGGKAVKCSRVVVQRLAASSGAPPARDGTHE